MRVGANKAKVISRAHVLLKSNEGKTDKEIAGLLYIDEETVRCTWQRFWDEGMEKALYGQPYPSPEPKLTDEQEAYLIGLACSEPPEGYGRWTIELLTERMVTDGTVDDARRVFREYYPRNYKVEVLVSAQVYGHRHFPLLGEY